MDEQVSQLANHGRVLFLGDQDAPFERTLKASLIESCLSVQPLVRSAYLVRVSYQKTPGMNVALCLNGGKENAPVIAESAGSVFRKHFGATEHLDIVFLSPQMLQEVAKVAKPFYTTL